MSTPARKLQITTPKVPNRKLPFFKGYLLPKIVFFARGFPKNGTTSIDVTNRCNLRCEHCYYYADEPGPELSSEEWLNRLEKMKVDGFPLRSCTWIGGEPLLKKEFVEKGRRYFMFNLVITNGTIPLPDWKDVLFHVSIDGPEEIHDKIRGAKGIYKKIKQNVLANPDLNTTLCCCISRSNADYIEQMLDEWHPTSINHMLFDFLTPIKGVKEDLWLNFKERDVVIDKLQRLIKEKYKDFIAVPWRTYELMRSKNYKKAVGKNCVFLNKGCSLKADGSRKELCMMGPEADCERCGCIIPFYLKLRTERQYILQEVWGDIKGLF